MEEKQSLGKECRRNEHTPRKSPPALFSCRKARFKQTP